MQTETWRFVRSVRVLDAAGEPRTVRVYRTVFEVPAGAAGTVEGVGRVRAVLDDGTPLTNNGDGTFVGEAGQAFAAAGPGTR
jgi:hypothetical protein